MATTTSIDVLKDKKILQYPLNLGASAKDAYDQDQQYMLFKINTDIKSTKLRDDKSLGQVTMANQSRDGTGKETQMTNFKSNDQDLVTEYGSKEVDKTLWVNYKGMQRLDRVIVLPMPAEHTVNTAVAYKDNPMTPLTKAGDMINQLGNGMMGELFSLGKNAGLSLLINKIKAGATNTDALLREERLAMNPKKEVIFDGFDFRQFSFRYSFAPKNKDESQMVNEIIETFRYYALPELSSAKMFYLLPAEFEISFMSGQKHNPNLPKITTSVLTRVSVNYSPRGVWSVLPNGSPVALDMTLEFRELELVDRKRVYDSGSAITSGY